MQVTLNVDVIRMPKDTVNGWRYENTGTITDLINTTSAVGLTNLPVTQSKTGVAFYQNDADIKIFNVPSASEIWVKFDVYSTGDCAWYLEDSTNSATGGIGSSVYSSSSTAWRDPLTLQVDNHSDNLVTLNDVLDLNTLQTFLIHMKSGASVGFIEIFTADKGLLYSYTGEFNRGQPFSMLDLVTDPNDDWYPPKVSEAIFSNIIISNNPVWLDEDVSVPVEVSLSVDTECNIVIGASLTVDVERNIYASIDYDVDVVRQIPYSLDITGNEPSPIIISPNSAGLQSINIQMSEQQLTDQISLVHAGDCNIMEQIKGYYLDYVFDLRIEETTTQGILQTCTCCTDIDEILYSQIAYTIPANKYEWAEDYAQEVLHLQQEHPDENIIAQPSTSIEEHLRTIAAKLGKTFTYRGVKYYSTASTEEHGGKTYASLITELVGWSSKLPQMEINVFIRAGTMYAIQRGYEANTVSLDNEHIANVKVNKKLVRTTWGSDVKSESTVDTYPYDWSEFDQEPYTPEGGGATYGDDNLIETKTTETGSERNVTTYQYDQDDKGGKYLSQEVTEKYELDNGTWNYVDTITTNHEKVSDTQAHISALDSEGGILGETVSTNRFEDRATPYDKGRGGSDYYLVHDGQGNYYKLYRICRYSETREKGTRTTYGLSLIDTSFPLYGDTVLAYLTQQLMWLNRKTEETITLDVYDLNHIVGFDDKISYNGATYYLKSNSVVKDERTVNKQSLTFVRWY